MARGTANAPHSDPPPANGPTPATHPDPPPPYSDPPPNPAPDLNPAPDPLPGPASAPASAPAPASVPALDRPLTANAAALRLIRDSLSRSRPAAFRLAWWTLVSALPALVCGKALALAVDEGFLTHHTPTAALYLCVFALCALCGAWASRQTYPPLADIVEPMRDRLHREVVQGTLRRAVAPGAPREGADAVVVARLTRQVEVVRDTVAGQLMLVWQFVLTAAAVVVGTAVIAPAAVPFVAVPLLLSLTVFGVLAPATVRRQHTAFEAEETLAHRSAATLASLRDIIATGTRDKAEREVLEAVRAHLLASRELAALAAVRRLIVGLGAHSPLLLVVLAAPALIDHGMTAGEVIGVLGYVLSTLEPAVRLLVQGVGASWIRLSVAAHRLAAAARHPAPPKDPLHPRAPADASLVLSDVTFAYGPAAAPILENVHLTLAHGEHLAVVGPSGVGKSTTADLLAGILHPDHGQITLGGAPLDRITPADLNRARVLLPQHPYVFAGTLRENLCQLAPHTPDHVISHTIDELGMNDLVRRVGGLDGQVDPAALSSGQRQLLALARAHLSPAGFVILDEATRHLDAEAEQRVEEAFRRRPGTVITLAHRISLARHADKVLLLDGQRAWAATHDSLLSEVPLYGDLVGHWNTGAARPDGHRPDATGHDEKNAPRANGSDNRPADDAAQRDAGQGRVSGPDAASDHSSSRPSADRAP
ncbi:ATP-binding cassette domain-containing protein [Streptomyces sp. NPDC101117]|uniref:ATP-binding cassette domain-containing protein n=1 Tax=Streptomyces sp. NPDC101117 TaxID=3366108 RepID=UPI00382F1E93